MAIITTERSDWNQDMNESVDRGMLERIKTIIRRDLKLGPMANVDDNMPLIGGELDLDSLDILLLVSSVEKEFAIKIPSEAVGRWVFQDVSTLAKYVSDNKNNLRADAPVAAAASHDWISRLPHGPEFRYLSAVQEVMPGQSAIGSWRVDGSEAFFRGHFPGNPIVPGVLLTEAMAQLAGLASSNETARAGKIVQIDIRFEQPVRPPAEIQLAAKVVTSVNALLQCEVSASVAGAIAARGTITLHIA